MKEIVELVKKSNPDYLLCFDGCNSVSDLIKVIKGEIGNVEWKAFNCKTENMVCVEVTIDSLINFIVVNIQFIYNSVTKEIKFGGIKIDDKLSSLVGLVINYDKIKNHGKN